MSKEIIKFTIPLEPITKKNSQRILVNKKTGRPFIMPSDKYKKYETDCGRYIPHVEKAIDMPVCVTEIFYRKTRRAIDLTNAEEAADDILVKYGILSDDNCDIIVSHDGSRVLYDKDNPRTEITITEIE